MKKSILLLFASCGLWLAGCATSGHEDAIKWQYKTVSSTSDEVLNTPLAEGWKVVSFTVTPDGNKWYLLKHKKIK